MISAAALLSLLVYVVCIGLVFWLLLWLVGFIGLPEPFAKVCKVVIAVFAVVFLIGVLMHVAGTPLVRF